MTKQEKIQEAYGEYWEEVKDLVNIKGWFYLCDTDFRLDDKMPLEFDALNNKMRPKSIQGIENNNGWVKIESEEDLPKEDGFYWVIDSEASEIVDRYFEKGNHDFFKQFSSHYQPIQKPEPPIY